MRTITRTTLVLALALSTSACLKTRAQLKDDGDDAGEKPVKANVQDVQPKDAYVIDEIKGEITRMTGKIEDLERSQQQANSPAKQEEMKKIEARIVELEHAQVQMIEAIKKLQSNVPPPDPTETFEKAKKEFSAGDYSAAIDGFTSYLKVPNGKLAEEATYLRGEAFYETKQYKKAIIDYSKFPEKFTRSKHMAQALYKIGLSFEALGLKEDAKGFYQELVDKHPKSAEAKKARPKLK
jgi:tol-pal system protein YbgF